MLGYFGPEGTFTHQALLALASNPQFDIADAQSYPSVGAALQAVRAGDVKAVMVPIENSVEGGVSATIDDLGNPDATPLQIIAEVLVNVTFDLAVRPGTQMGDVRQVITHPHAAAQTRAWLAKHMPQATVVERGSTAGAAKEVANPGSEFDAAVCAPVATKLYGLTALAHDIEDNDAGVTRFVLVSQRCACPAPTGHDKTSLTAYVHANHSGALLEILQQFAVRGVSLCRIESRPTKTALGSYCFSIDAEGHIDEARMAESLMGLKRVCQNVVFLGSYPRADEVASAISDGASDADYAGAQGWIDSLQPGSAQPDSPQPENDQARPDFTMDPNPPAAIVRRPAPLPDYAPGYRPTLPPPAGLRTRLFLTDEPPLAAVPQPWQRQPATGIPLISMLLVSQNSRLVPSMSSPMNGQNTIMGNFQAGRDEVLTFLKRLGALDLFDKAELLRRTNQLSVIMIAMSPIPGCVSMEITGTATAGDTAKQVFDDLQDLTSLEQWYIDALKRLKDAGQIEDMWRVLGLTEQEVQRWQGSEFSSPVTARSGNPAAASRFSGYYPAPRPGIVTFICVLQIVLNIIAVILYLILVVTIAGLSRYDLGGLGVLLFFLMLVGIGIAIWCVVLCVQMLDGSATARRIWTILTIIGLVIDIYEVFTGSPGRFVATVVIQIAILVALYSEGASRFFEQFKMTSSRPPLTQTRHEQPQPTDAYWYH